MCQLHHLRSQRHASPTSDFLTANGNKDHLDADLKELFTRIIFNILVTNTDDHLRNHGFMVGGHGWRLAPAFDLNPNPDKPDHAISIDDVSHVSDLQVARETSQFYRLSLNEAEGVIHHVGKVVAQWREQAGRLGIAASEIRALSRCFKQF